MRLSWRCATVGRMKEGQTCFKFQLRRSVGWCVAAPFVVAGARRRAAARYDAEGTVLSLCAHDPTPEVLGGALEGLLRRGFQFHSEDEVLRGRLRPRAAWLSFDDGWKGFLRCLPVLERLGVPATLFIATDATARGFLWTNALMPHLPMRRIRALYALPEAERMAVVEDVLGGRFPNTLLSPEEVARLARHPLLTLGNHSASHLSCSHRPVGEVAREIDRAQRALRTWTGVTPRLFCYPFGHRTAETDAAVRAAGLWPIGLAPGIDRVSAFGRFRNMLYDNVSTAENLCRVLGSWVPIRKT